MGNVLLPDHPLTTAKQDIMYNDPYYGLADYNNYYHWNALLESTVATERIAWKWELKTYFDLTLV